MHREGQDLTDPGDKQIFRARNISEAPPTSPHEQLPLTVLPLPPPSSDLLVFIYHSGLQLTEGIINAHYSEEPSDKWNRLNF